ncbi:MAG: nucleotidyltransferase [Chloracidobacterium sp.]|nr:nucleotidyltransferase [Chloracidobacterium sp.]
MLNPDFRDILWSLKNAAVDFIVVGAFALASHGRPRATGDIDIFLRNSPDNAERIMAALRDFGAPLDKISVEDFTSRDNVVQLGLEPRRIDLMTRISGVSFDEAWKNKVAVAIGDLEVFVLSKSDLLANKKAADRDKDSGDIAWLTENS